jgi:hypothetical protein
MRPGGGYIMRILKKMVAAAAVVLLLAGLLEVSCRFITASLSYGVYADFEVLPADDQAFEDWLKSQPGVVPHTVHLYREGKRLNIFFIMTRDGWGRPAVPDLEGACRRLGYGGPHATFRDIPPE